MRGKQILLERIMENTSKFAATRNDKHNTCSSLLSWRFRFYYAAKILIRRKRKDAGCNHRTKSRRWWQQEQAALAHSHPANTAHVFCFFNPLLVSKRGRPDRHTEALQGQCKASLAMDAHSILFYERTTKNCHLQAPQKRKIEVP